MPLNDFNRRCVKITLNSLQAQPIERKILIATLLGLKKPSLRRNESTTILGRDLLAKKICPDSEMLFQLVSGLMDVESILADEVYSSALELDTKTIRHLQSKTFIHDIRLNREELLEVWYTIATYETTEYLRHLLNKLGVEISIDSKAKATIHTLLECYSVSQLWSLAYKAYQKGCEVHMKQGARDTVSGEVFLDIFLEKGQLYCEKGWHITSFNRWGYPCRQSEYSAYFFNEILGIGSAGFTTKASIQF